MDAPLDLPWGLDIDMAEFFSMDEEEDGIDLSSLSAPDRVKDFLCMKQDHAIDLVMDYDFSLMDSLGSIGDLNGAAKTLGTAEIVSDQRMEYVYCMLMDNVLGSTLGKGSASQFGHTGEAGFEAAGFEARISDEHLRELCQNTKAPGDLFARMKEIQHFYLDEKRRLLDLSLAFVDEMKHNLQRQFTVRPPSEDELLMKVSRIEEKMEVTISRLQFVCNRLLVQLQIHNSRNKRRRNLDPAAVNALRTWFEAHTNHPYPSEAEKEELCQETDLSVGQISTWFVNARARYPWRSAAPPKDQWQ